MPRTLTLRRNTSCATLKIIFPVFRANRIWASLVRANAAGSSSACFPHPTQQQTQHIASMFSFDQLCNYAYVQQSATMHMFGSLQQCICSIVVDVKDRVQVTRGDTWIPNDLSTERITPPWASCPVTHHSTMNNIALQEYHCTQSACSEAADILV